MHHVMGQHLHLHQAGVVQTKGKSQTDDVIPLQPVQALADSVHVFLLCREEGSMAVYSLTDIEWNL